jgi:hypothetical protein
MNWEAVGAVAEAVGALGVIVSLLYLAVQIRQSNRGLRATAYKDLLLSIVSTREFISSSSELPDVWHAGLRSFDSLSEADRYRFATIMARAITNLEIALHFHELGVLEYSMLEPRERTILGLLRSPGGTAWWKNAQLGAKRRGASCDSFSRF